MTCRKARSRLPSFEMPGFRNLILDYGLSPDCRDRYQQASYRLERWLRRRPREAHGWMLLGTFRLGLDQPQSGRQAFQQALEVNPALAEAHRLRSESYRREHRLAEALEAANQSVALAPTEALSYCQRAAVWADQRRFAAGDVIRAEQQGLALCNRYRLGFSVTLGPTNREAGLRQVDLPRRDGGTEAVADLGGRSARRTLPTRNQNYIYFAGPRERPPTHGVWVLVEYWDALENRLRIE